MKWTRFRLPALLVAAALLLASCGNTGFSGGGAGGGNNGMEGMNHGDSGGGETSRQETTGGGMAGMDHSSMDDGSMGMAREMVMENGRYSDERFIDAMVPHHRGAVEMAEVALENADHEKISSLAENIVCAQEAEIEELKAIKEQEFGISEVPMEMSAQEMKAMGMTDPQVLAGRRPFDKAFIDAMIPHHRSANAMASVTLRESHNAQIKEIARAIVDAQEKEIAQMQRWREEWYPRG
jgi:uncharacterized protein (DUF305 family)